MSQKLLDLKIWCFQHCSPWGLESPNLIPVPPSWRRLTLTTQHDFAGIYYEKSLSKEIWFLFLEDYSCPAHSFLLGYLNSALVLCILCKDFWGRGGRATLCPVDRSVEGQAGGSAWAEVPTRPRILQGVDASPMAWGKMLKGVLSFQAKPPYSGNQKSREQAFHRG